MATRIKRSLFIGLGGTGMTSLLHTKKMFIDTYGDVPPMIGFLGIDTDGGAYNKGVTGKSGEKITLSPNEQLPITVKDARPIYDVNRSRLTWLPEKNLYALTGMTLGAGMVRSNGRFAFTVNHEKVARKVREMLTAISNASISSDDRYELISNTTNIYLIFSIGGGTGCGTFINMAYLLRKEAPECKLTAYAVLPDVFKAMAQQSMPRVRPNAYGAIADLDYLMSMSFSDQPFTLEYLGNDSYDIRERPFNSVILVDNRNENGDAYTHVDQLAEMISLGLVTSAGELSDAANSMSDNLEKDISNGEMDIRGKKAWAAGMGVCEIIYRSSDLSRYYSMKAAKHVIEQMLNSCEDADAIANNWIDSVNIRENEGCDNVIDFICGKEPRYTDFSINAPDNPKPEAEQFIASNRYRDEELAGKVTDLKTRSSEALQKLMFGLVNKECGISSAANVLASISSQLSIFISELKKEKEEFQDMEPKTISALDIACADLSDYDKKFFKKSSRTAEYADDVVEKAKQIVVCRNEITRRNLAINFFTQLQIEIADWEKKIEELRKKFTAAYASLTNDLSGIRNNVDRAVLTFQIDLSSDKLTETKVRPEEISIKDFVRSLDNRDILAFADYDSDTLKGRLIRYTSRLETSRKLLDTTVDDIINGLDEESFEKMMTLALRKALPLFRYDYRGFAPTLLPNDSFYIGVPDKRTCRISKDAVKGVLKSSSDVDIVSIGMSDRVIFYHQIGVVPAYTLEQLPRYKEEYDSCPAACYIDANLKRRMEKEGFSLYPKMEDENDSIELWVKSLLFGLVKNEEGTYFVKSSELGDILDDNWFRLDTYRDDAFRQFCRYRESFEKELNDTIDEEIKTKGRDEIDRLIADAKKSYLDKYSQLNMSKDQLKAKGFERVAELVRQELAYVKNL